MLFAIKFYWYLTSAAVNTFIEGQFGRNCEIRRPEC